MERLRISLGKTLPRNARGDCLEREKQLQRKKMIVS